MIRSLPISWSYFYLFLFMYRSLFSVLGEVVVMRLTNIGDTVNYQNADLLYTVGLMTTFSIDSLGAVMVIWATLLTEFVGGVFRILFFGNPILINIGFQTITFVGIYLLLRSVEPRVRRPLALLFLSPSFTLWTSIATKESIVVFLICVISTYLVGIYYNRERLGVHHVAAFVLLYIYKPHFLAAVAFLVAGTKIAKAMRQKTAIAVLGIALSMAVLYVYRDAIDRYALQVTEWLSSDKGQSTREPYLVETYDVFVKAPYGMLQSFVGPTVSEASRGVLHLFSFIEAVIMIALLGYFVVRELPRLPVYSLVLGLGTTFWIVFATYPFGMPNPGSAVRYRTDYVVLVFVAVVFLLSRDLYVSWRLGIRRGPERRGRPVRIAGPPPVGPR